MSSPEIVFAGTDGGAVTELPDYEAGGGLEALRRAREMTPDEIIAELNASNLRGRGGAFFPTGRKWSFVPKPDQNPRPHYLVVNADESEPGTFKDREIMLRVPFRFLEGCLIAARAIESTHVFVYIRGEYEREYEVLVHALEQLRKGKHLGGVTIVVHRGAGAYICGEETALLESLEGERGQPRTKPPFPAIAGLYASPTAVNNVESIATVPPVIEMGGAEYAKLGLETSTGTRVFSLSGNVANPGNYELPHGFPLKDLIHDVGGGIPDGRTLKAVIPGGSSTPILTAAEAERVTLDFDSLSQAGTMIGSAAVIVIDDRACMVQLGIRVSQFYEHESCGKCTPCRVGTRWLTQILKKIEAGTGTHADLDLLLDVGERINGTCLCPLGDSDAIAVASYVAKFREEFLAHVEEGGCPFHGTSSLDAIVAPTDVHAHTSARPRSRARSRWWREIATRAAVAAAKPTPSGICPARRAGIEPQVRLLPNPAWRERNERLDHRHDRRPRGRGREGHGPGRDGGRRRDRDPGLLLRAAARAARRRLPHVPRRDRGAAEAPGRLHADRAGGNGRAHGRDVTSARRTASRERSSSSSSTTRSTARSATRAASARCRT